MELGEPDASGRRSPVAIPGATETIDIDLAIVSVGVSPNPIVPSSIPGLEMGRKGTIAVNENMQSSIPTIMPEVILFVVVLPLFLLWAMDARLLPQCTSS